MRTCLLDASEVFFQTAELVWESSYSHEPFIDSGETSLAVMGLKGSGRIVGVSKEVGSDLWSGRGVELGVDRTGRCYTGLTWLHLSPLDLLWIPQTVLQQRCRTTEPLELPVK